MQPKLYAVFIATIVLPCFLMAQSGLSVNFNADYTTGCGPLKVKFTDLSIPPANDNIISWQWDFGDGGTSAQNNPTHIYSADGYYTVRLTAITNTGIINSALKTSYIAVGNFLSVKLGNDTAICSGTNVTLDAGNTNVSWLWSNGATTQTISAGQGTWSVTVTQRGCTASDTIVIGTSAPLSSQLSYKMLTSCLPVAVQFTDISIACPGNTINKWLWNFGDGTTSTLQNPIHSYTNTGSFTVKLTVTTAGNLSNTRSKSIFITNGTPPVVNLGNDTTVCQNAGFALDAANAGATYQWNTNQTTQTITVSKTGTYWVAVNKNGCIGKDTALITVNPSPVINLGKDTTICIGTVLQLDAGNSGASFLWSTGDTTRQIGVGNDGSWWVKADKAGCSSADTIYVTTQNAVAPAFGYKITSTCLPVLVKFTDSSIVRCGPVTQWHWDFGDGSTSNQQNPQHSYYTTRAFSVQLDLTTGTGPAASVSKTIYIENTVPVANPEGIYKACKGSPVQLTAGVDNAAYRWTPAAGLSNDTIENPVLMPGVTTLYHVEITKCLVTLYNDILVSVDSIGTPVIMPGDTALISSAAPFYQWYKNNTALAGDTLQTLYPGGVGAYTVKVYNTNGCTAISNPVVFLPKNKTANLLKDIYVNCSPNPGPGLITIALSSVPVNGITIKCIDGYGKYVYTNVIRNSFNRLDLTMYPKGVYFIVMEYDGARLTVPVVIQ